jgi:hypothetical protein
MSYQSKFFESSDTKQRGGFDGRGDGNTFERYKENKLVMLQAETKKLKENLSMIKMDLLHKNALISDMQNPDNVHLVHEPDNQDEYRQHLKLLQAQSNANYQLMIKTKSTVTDL